MNYLKQIRDDNEPTRRALMMAEAVLEHLNDLAEDDPGDDASDDDLIGSAQDNATNLVYDLRQLLRKR